MSEKNGSTKGFTEDKLIEQALNYILANHFYVEMQSGTITACFSECSGLGVTIETETFHEGGVNNQQRILLGQSKFSEVTLKRGMTNDMTFWEWMSQVLEGRGSDRRNISILLFNQAGETIQSWELVGAVPTSWKAPSLQADANNVAIEELTLTYEGLRMSKDSGGSVKSGNRDIKGYLG